jgi:transcriptional regulator with XRE-family HTH domain
MTQEHEGPQSPSIHIAHRVRALRDAEGISAAGVAKEVSTDHGLAMTRDTLANIEIHRRGNVTVEELFALALVLNVSPTNLLLPDDPEEEVAVSGGVTATAWWVREWIYGREALPARNDTESFMRAAPAAERERYRNARHPLVVALGVLQGAVFEALSDETESNATTNPKGHADYLRRQAEDIVQYVELLARQLDRRAEESSWRP